MKILAVSEELSVLTTLKRSLEVNFTDAEVFTYQKISEVPEPACGQDYDVVFFDVDASASAVFKKADTLKREKNDLNIIFISSDSTCALEAIKMHASGYIVKPFDVEAVKAELDDLRYPLREEKLLRVKCFGNFDVFTPSGELVKFKRSKSKELLAILISKKGASCTTNELMYRLFGTEGEDEKKKDYIQQVISTLIRGLREVGAQAVINKTYNSMSINTDKVECEYYEIDENDIRSLNSYNGEFMAQYSWAEQINKYICAIAERQLNCS